jgi:hypothetical protein
VLSEREQRSLGEIELSLRADDRPLARSLELFRLEPLLAELEEETRRTALRTFIRRARWVLAITAIASIVPLWGAVLMTSGTHAALAQIFLLPLSSLLLGAGMALHPDRRRRTPRRVAQRRARDSDGHGWPATTR